MSKGISIYGYEMARISEVYLSTLSCIMKPYELERGFVPLIYICEHSGKITQKDLGVALRKDKVSIMRRVDYLCELGLVQRVPDESDRRCHKLEATKKGFDLLPFVKEGIKKTNTIFFEGFTKEEKKIFQKGMNKLFERIGKLPEPTFIIEAYKRKK